MINEEESGVVQSPVPLPICSASDFAIPKPATLGFCVRSFNCAKAERWRITAIAHKAVNKRIAINFDDVFFMQMNTFRLRWCALRQADKIRFQIPVSVCGLSL